MKPKILKLSSIVLLFLFIGVACQKDEIPSADESIEISSMPGISIYKTNGDYRNYLAVCLDSLDNITCTPLFGNDSSIVQKNSKGDYVLKSRYALKNGYMLGDIYLDYAFTDITVNEMVEKYLESGPSFWTINKYSERIIDRDPFTEFYYLDGLNMGGQKFTLGEINKMIENGTLETVFTKLK